MGSGRGPIGIRRVALLDAGPSVKFVLRQRSPVDRRDAQRAGRRGAIEAFAHDGCIVLIDADRQVGARFEIGQNFGFSK